MSKIEEMARALLKQRFQLNPDAKLQVTETGEPITQLDLVIAGARAVLVEAYRLRNVVVPKTIFHPETEFREFEAVAIADLVALFEEPKKHE